LSPEKIFWLVVLVLAALAFRYLFRRAKGLSRETFDPWADPGLVDHMLVLAADQRAPLELVSLAPGENASLAGFCARLDQRVLFFQARQPLPSARHDAWNGKKVSVHAQTQLGDDARMFCFDSLVLRGPTDDGPPLLELARPSRLEFFERRAFSRVRSAPSELIALGLWDWPVNSPEQNPPTEPSLLPPPLLVLHPARRFPAELHDVSASGLALDIMQNPVFPFPEHCLVLLSLSREESGSRPLTLWLACSARHATEYAGGACVRLGLHTRYWCRITRADVSLFWRNAAGDGVPPLLRRTVRRPSVGARGLFYPNL
jgi:hypothetical protein